MLAITCRRFHLLPSDVAERVTMLDLVLAQCLDGLEEN